MSLPEEFLQDAARRAFSLDKSETPEQFAARLERNFTRLNNLVKEINADLTSGAILNSIIDAKGDLIVGSAADTPIRKAVGADDTILMADTAAGGGVKWAAPASPGATINAGDAASEGTADTWSRSDHQHAVSTASPGSTINAGDSASEGTATSLMRSDAQMAVSTAAAITLTGTNAEGTATSLARSDHNHAFPAWTTWSPTWTNLSVGDGTVSARYVQHGKFVRYTLSLVWGSTTSASGSVLFSLPVTSVSPAGTAGISPIGVANYLDSGTATYTGVVEHQTTTTALLVVGNVAGTYNQVVAVNATIPFTGATNDQFAIFGTYEAA